MITPTFSQTVDKTYILVHGAGHGAWCWKKVIPLLETYGYRVAALDLPSCGNDKRVLERITLGDDVQKVTDAASAQSGKVILVGHSSGGVVISQAAEILGSEKVDKLVYLDAFLPQHGESVFSLAGKIKANNATASSLETEISAAPLLFSVGEKIASWNPEIVEQYFYHDCAPEDIAYAKTHLRSHAVAALSTPVNVTDPRYGRIPKYYILCTAAKDLDKSSIVQNMPCQKVYELPSSHSPFFSMPEKLVIILDEIYNLPVVATTR
jgi:pimeloyl-ACP methyl ester carboxylesterase